MITKFKSGTIAAFFMQILEFFFTQIEQIRQI